MRNYFTITISDVHGARHYSFKQFIRKFFWLVLVLFVALWVLGAVSIWWLNYEANQVEKQHEAIVDAFVEDLKATQSHYEILLVERSKLREELKVTSSQVNYLDQTLQGLEKLVGEAGEASEPMPLSERIKQVQLTSLGKDMMLSMIPNGHAVQNFKGITSGYGYRKHPLTGKRHLHAGVDYRGKKGAPVIATADGVVNFSALKENSAFGELISVTHSNGFRTVYAHLSKRLVKVGQYVQKGDVIGEIGTTGRSTGNHLHYEVWFVFRRLNPKYFNDWSIENYDEIFTKIKGVPWGSLSQAVANRVKRVEKQLLLRDVPLPVKSVN
ncbi:MAG: peptidoglycan DD-metalloendopeptidase family protein [Thiomicrorhabdus sp.]|nr:peptidoglycan DD-metalloendopeptidase family protein [Thiomicrorhabdus sp.]